jgi:hypothetical protein
MRWWICLWAIPCSPHSKLSSYEKIKKWIASRLLKALLQSVVWKTKELLKNKLTLLDRVHHKAWWCSFVRIDRAFENIESCHVLVWNFDFREPSEHFTLPCWSKSVSNGLKTDEMDQQVVSEIGFAVSQRIAYPLPPAFQRSASPSRRESPIRFIRQQNPLPIRLSFRFAV